MYDFGRELAYLLTKLTVGRAFLSVHKVYSLTEDLKYLLTTSERSRRILLAFERMLESEAIIPGLVEAVRSFITVEENGEPIIDADRQQEVARDLSVGGCDPVLEILQLVEHGFNIDTNWLLVQPTKIEKV